MNFIWGFIGGIIAWFATEFVGRPIKAFFAARDDVARILAEFEDLEYYTPDDKWGKVEEDAAVERTKALRAAGATLISFYNSNQFLIPLVHIFSFRPKNAGDSLLLLAQMVPDSPNCQAERNKIMRYLRLGHKPE